MTTKTTVAKTPGVKATTSKKSTTNDPKKTAEPNKAESTADDAPKPKAYSKAAFFDHLTDLVEGKKLLERHLETLGDNEQDPDFLETMKSGESEEAHGDPVTAVVLQFSQYNKYSINNPVLMNEVLNFIKDKLYQRKEEIEAEIETMMKE